MNALSSRIRAAFFGRDPADVAAEAIYAAMVTPPAYVSLALACEGAPDRTARAALLATVDDVTRAQAVQFMGEPKALREKDRRLAWARADRDKRFPALLTYYGKHEHMGQFIDDWFVTHDPRLKDKVIEFKLFPRQKQMIEAMLDSYRNKEPLSIVKARDSGASWIACALLVTLAIFEDGFTAIIGSQLEIKIDVSGTTGTLFHKIRMALEYLPEEFRGGWTLKGGSASMRVWFPNGSTIQGEAGDAIGRSSRCSIALCDEYAHLEHPDLVDASLMATTEVKWYVSSVCGQDNPFAKRVREGKTKVFLYTWQDDPRKTPEWAAKKIAADGQRKFNQEYGCDFSAGNVDRMFPQEHLDGMVGAHVKLGVEATGRLYGALDVGNGGDPSAFCIFRGCVCIHIETWPSSTNLYKEVRKAFSIADRFGLTEFCADSIGVGAGVESIAQQINVERTGIDPETQRPRRAVRIIVHSFKSSESPLFPERPIARGSGVKVKDYYPNKKSQGFDSIRHRLATTFQCLQGDRRASVHDIISISSEIPVENRNKLLLELAQICCEESPGGKLQIDKYGGGESPNAADAFMMATAPRNTPMVITEADIASMD